MNNIDSESMEFNIVTISLIAQGSSGKWKIIVFTVINNLDS